MKKLVLVTSMVTIGIFTTVFVSCTKEKNINTESVAQPKKNVKFTSGQLAQTTTSENLLKETRDIQVTEINLVSNTDDIEYVFKLKANALQFNGIDGFTLDNQEVKLTTDGTIITMAYGNGRALHYDPTNHSVSFLNDGQIVALGTWSSGQLILDKATEDELVWGLVVFNEFVNNEAVRYIESPEEGAKHGGWVTYNGGASRSMALLRTQREAREFLRNNPNCVIVGDYDTSCLWENHACIASVHYNCV